MEFEQILSQIVFCKVKSFQKLLKLSYRSTTDDDDQPKSDVLTKIFGRRTESMLNHLKADDDIHIVWNSNSQLGQMMKNLTDFDSITMKSDNTSYTVNILLNMDGMQTHNFGDCSWHKEIKSIDKPFVIPSSSQKPPCKFMLKKNRPCQILKTINQHFNNKNKQDNILKHLEMFDHFEYFGKEIPSCPFKTNEKCIHFQRILNNNYKFKFMDKKHLCMYYHPIAKHQLATNSQIINDRELPLFEYVTGIDVVQREDLFEKAQAQQRLSQCMQKNRLLFLLLDEVISNGYENDLIPIKDNEEKKNIDQFDATKLINHVINGNVNILDLSGILDQLKTHYRIFEILDEKMNHERHKQTNYALSKAELLALILYCNGVCNYNLSMCQRDGTYVQKWVTFDTLLNDAILQLSRYESHNENIYTGLAGVSVDIYRLYRQGMFSNFLFFKSNVSGTRSIKVAYQFRGDEGVILGINLKQSFEENIFGFLFGDSIIPHACDVSWISKYPSEQEVLFSRHSPFAVYPSKSVQVGKNQWLVCNLGYDDKTFERMFGQISRD